MPTYTIFAGVNGAGKTSIYRTIYYEENKLEKRINTDEMVERIGSWQDNNLQIRTAREAVKLLNYYIHTGISFNQETTLSGKTIVKNIITAKSKGYHVVMNYIGIESPDIAKERVRIRVSNGGHGISEDLIERRYHESLQNLRTVIGIYDELNIYDNTNKFEQIAYIFNGELKWKSVVLPNWTKDIFK